MRALELTRHAAKPEEIEAALRVVEKPVPKPGPGQVLVRVEASPCNPSDLSFLAGTYETERKAPAVPGFECSGVVVAADAGVMGMFLRGRRVACATQSAGDGTWAEYCIVDAPNCLPLLSGVDFEQGSALIVNPLTAVGLLSRVRAHKSPALIQNAAASQLGKMILALAGKEGIEVINIVRREEQAHALRKLGARHVLDSSQPGFVSELAVLAGRLRASTALDAIGGPMTGLLLGAVPPGGQVITYGILSGEPPSGFNEKDIVFRGKTFTGFHLGRHTAARGMLKTMGDAIGVQRAVKKGIIRMDIRARLTMENAPRAIAAYAAQMSDGKVIILPQSG